MMIPFVVGFAHCFCVSTAVNRFKLEPTFYIRAVVVVNFLWAHCVIRFKWLHFGRALRIHSASPWEPFRCRLILFIWFRLVSHFVVSEILYTLSLVRKRRLTVN